MKQLLCSISGLVICASAFGAGITPGDLVIARVGDGSAALSSAATAVFLDEYTPAGSYVQTIAMPSTYSGGNWALTVQGTATSEGFLQLSANGQFLTMGGYGTNAGTPAPSGVAASTTPRVVGVVNVGNGSVNTTTAISSGTAGAIRSVASDDGTHFWVSSASAGVGYVSGLGANTALQLSSTPSNTRVTHDFGGQLFVSAASGSFQGVATIGTGLPTTASQTTTMLPGMPTASGPSAYDFFVSGNNAWVADDRTSGLGGLQKWSLSGGTWTLQYTINRTAAGDRGLAADLSGANPVFYVTTTDNKVDMIVDGGTLADSTITTLFSDTALNTAFRGIVYVPEPSAAALSGLGFLLLGVLRRRK